MSSKPFIAGMLACLVLACAHAPDRVAADKVTSQDLSDADLAAEVHAIAIEVANLRHAPVPTPTVRVLDDTAFSSVMAAQVKRTSTVLTDAFRPFTALYGNKMDTARDQAKEIRDRETLAFYDPLSKTIIFRVTALQRISRKEVFTRHYVIAHELTHAIQDARVNLNQLFATRSPDQFFALKSLFEGDADLTATLVLAHNGPAPHRSDEAVLADTDERMRKAALPTGAGLQAQMMQIFYFPYFRGFHFAHAIYQAGRWAALDRALGHGPQSTGQILHPERYLAGLPVGHVELDRSLGGNSIEMGELMQQLYLRSLTGDLKRSELLAAQIDDSIMNVQRAPGTSRTRTIMRWQMLSDTAAVELALTLEADLAHRILTQGAVFHAAELLQVIRLSGRTVVFAVSDGSLSQTALMQRVLPRDLAPEPAPVDFSAGMSAPAVLAGEAVPRLPRELQATSWQAQVRCLVRLDGVLASCVPVDVPTDLLQPLRDWEAQVLVRPSARADGQYVPTRYTFTLSPATPSPPSPAP